MFKLQLLQAQLNHVSLTDCSCFIYVNNTLHGVLAQDEISTVASNSAFRLVLKYSAGDWRTLGEAQLEAVQAAPHAVTVTDIVTKEPVGTLRVKVSAVDRLSEADLLLDNAQLRSVLASIEQQYAVIRDQAASQKERLTNEVSALRSKLQNATAEVSRLSNELAKAVAHSNQLEERVLFSEIFDQGPDIHRMKAELDRLQAHLKQSASAVTFTQPQLLAEANAKLQHKTRKLIELEAERDSLRHKHEVELKAKDASIASLVTELAATCHTSQKTPTARSRAAVTKTPNPAEDRENVSPFRTVRTPVSRTPNRHEFPQNIKRLRRPTASTRKKSEAPKLRTENRRKPFK